MSTVDELLGPAPLPTVDEILGPASLPTVDDVLGMPQPAVPLASSQPGGQPTMADRAPLIDEILKPRGEAKSAGGRVLGAATDAVKTLFSGEYGPSDETLGRLVNQTPEDVNSPMGLVRTFNRVLLEGGGAAIDVSMRAMMAAIVAPAVAAGEALKEAGMSDGAAHRLTRDIIELSQAAGFAVGAPNPLQSRNFRMAARERIAAAADDLPPTTASEATARAASAFDEAVTVAKREAGDAEAVPPLNDPASVQDKLNKYADAHEIPIENIAKNGDGASSPWLLADGKFVSSAGDHLHLGAELDIPGAYTEIMKETGAARVGVYDSPGGFGVSVHVRTGQGVTPEQYAAIRKIYDDRDGDLRILYGETDTFANPKYTPLTIDDLAKKVVERDAVPLTEPRITQALTKEVVDAASELLTLGKVQRAEGRLISDQIMELLQTKRLTTEQIGEVLAKHNVTPDAFAELWRVNIRKAAQDMQALSALEQRVKALNKMPDAEGELAALQEQAGLGANERGLNWWRRVENVRRGMLVTQLSTAVRNFETQVGRVALDTLQQGLDDALRRTFSSPEVRAANPTDAFGTVMNIFRRPVETKAEVDAILSAFPKEQDRLFNSWMAEYQTGMFGKAEAVVNALNVANRFQENIVRRAVFSSRLSVELEKAGKSLDDIVARNAVGEIPREAVEQAVNAALEMTFSKNFSPFAKGAEGMAGTFINAVNNLPGLTIAVPFPRFLMNAVKFQYEWSPLGYLRLLSPTERAAVAAGDMSAISRATIGTGLLLTALQFRDSEYAGEKWYELRLPDGKIVDMRPFNPFASYLFMADVVKRSRDGTLDKLTTADVANGVLAASMRAGTGVYVLDTLFTEIAGLDGGEKGWRTIQDLAGNYLSGFTVPFNMVADFVAEFDEAQRVVRSGKEGPVIGPVNVGPIIRNIPGVNQSLPESRNPLREGPILKEAPALKQFTGALVNAPKNPVEKEIDRLGITWKEYFPSTGDPTADRMIATQMGIVVSRALPQLVESDGYKSLPNPVQAYVLLNALSGARTAAKEIVSGQEPALTARMKLEGMPSRQRKAINALTAGSLDEAIQMLRGVSDELQ